MRIIELQNNGRKLAKQLLRLVDFKKGNNYQDTNLRVVILDNEIIVSTFCVNEFGRAWCNQNHTRVERKDIPFFTLKKLGMV
jgi:hypothetical protein